MSLDPFAIKDVLCYDGINSKTLTTGERIVIHQRLGQFKSVPPELQIKMTKIHKRILEEKWQRPIVKYNDEYQIEIINPNEK